MILSCYGGKMKKILLMVLILVCMFNAGCTKQDDFEHYALSDRDLNVYIYSNNGYDEVYALADLTVQNLEETRTGLFYKVANNDYILLNTLTSNKIDAYKMKSVYQFYGDKELLKEELPYLKKHMDYILSLDLEYVVERCLGDHGSILIAGQFRKATPDKLFLGYCTILLLLKNNIQILKYLGQDSDYYKSKYDCIFDLVSQ